MKRRRIQPISSKKQILLEAKPRKGGKHSAPEGSRIGLWVLASVVGCLGVGWWMQSHPSHHDTDETQRVQELVEADPRAEVFTMTSQQSPKSQKSRTPDKTPEALAVDHFNPDVKKKP